MKNIREFRHERNNRKISYVRINDVVQFDP